MVPTARPVPLRTCVACRTERPKRELVRFVRTAEGQAMLDLTGRRPGRGAYLCADGTCWSAAHKKHSLERALEASLAPELRRQLELGAPPTIEGGIRGS